MSAAEKKDNFPPQLKVVRKGYRKVALRNTEVTMIEASERMTWVNCYFVTRHYGGPEEGGWWYNITECRESEMALIGDDADKVLAEMQKEFGAEAYGNIYHSTGGLEVYTRIEAEMAQSEDTEKPRYE
jgi:hypothetical protein